MDRNNNLLKILFTSVGLETLVNCLGKDSKEYISDLPDYNLTLEEAVGKYYYIPIKDEFYNRDDYKFLKLNKGDTLFLEIKKDSTYFFNKIYYNQAQKFENLSGRITIRNNKISINPDTSKIKVKYVYPRGFKKSDTSGFYFYYCLSYPTDPTEFGYFINYKKMK